MMGWLRNVWAAHAANPALEQVGIAKLNGRATVGVPIYRLEAGSRRADLTLGPYGYARNAAASYAEFKRLRDAGKIPPGTRLQVTMAGPGTTSFGIQLDAAVLLPIAREALWREIADILKIIPADDLTIHLDVAMEAEKEEYLRRPEAFDTPIQTSFYWTHEQMADTVASLANRYRPPSSSDFTSVPYGIISPTAGRTIAFWSTPPTPLSERITRPHRLCPHSGHSGTRQARGLRSPSKALRPTSRNDGCFSVW